MDRSDDFGDRVEQRSGAGPVLLFDGVCNFCHAAVQFAIRHDRSGRVRFAPLQSEVAHRLLANHDRPPAERGSTSPHSGSPDRHPGVSPQGSHDPHTVVLIARGEVYTRSDAVLALLRELDRPWPQLYALRAIPRPLRDRLYTFVARHRYRWFGRKTVCPQPTQEQRLRFLVDEVSGSEQSRQDRG
ncbi:MAG: thiol-disulfide oxidoreductase DCC family protein [Firmicutes bacterium]|nr:thiol-disulfide oxidoreductase DCC family protein [Bacillota bacterium]